MMKPRPSTAYHEAGHAVVALSLGVPFLFVTVKETDDYLGVMRHPEGYSEVLANSQYEEFGDEAYKAAAMVSIAGYAAECIYSGSPGDFMDDCYEHDRSSFIDLVMRLGMDTERIGLRIAAETRALLESRWPEVELVAATLLERQTLTAQEVENLLGGNA
jgi:hypothetical protein